MRIGGRILAGLTALVSTSGPGVAANLCTIDRVERSADGVNVFFSAMRILSINRPGAERRTLIADPRAREAVGRDRLGPFRGASLYPDDRVLMPFGDYRWCEIIVFAKDGKVSADVTLWEPRVGGHADILGEPRLQSFAPE
ncbi:MAG: hypothetical protein FD144_624 [Rhodospirillaceae bacterium]|nr:MAG: hypothetical protein FD144_624 [Rhodospirillaceae bacterium]